MSSVHSGQPSQGFRLNRSGPIAILTIDRPESRNSLTLEMQSEFVLAWINLQSDEDVRVMVVTGAENPAESPEKQAFCAGSDLKELAQDGPGVLRIPIVSLGSLDMSKPVIAAVNGHCIGAGMGMMLASDLRVSSPSATFGLPELQFGMVPGNGGIRRAARDMPHALVMELLLLGNRLSAERARELGLVNAIVPHESVLETAMNWADRIAALSVPAVQAAMRLASTSSRLGVSEAAWLEDLLLATLYASSSSQHERSPTVP